MSNYVRFTQSNVLTESEAKALLNLIDHCHENGFVPGGNNVLSAYNKIRRALKDKPKKGAGVG